jgi:hypothetical protein
MSLALVFICINLNKLLYTSSITSKPIIRLGYIYWYVRYIYYVIFYCIVHKLCSSLIIMYWVNIYLYYCCSSLIIVYIVWKEWLINNRICWINSIFSTNTFILRHLARHLTYTTGAHINHGLSHLTDHKEQLETILDQVLT